MTIYIGNEKIQVHFLVLKARCELISEEVIEVNGLKYHERWSHLSKNVVSAFVSYLYTGIVDMELVIPGDINAAKYFANNYPMLKSWKLFVDCMTRNDDDQTY